jgi:hypothetical protein
MVKQNVFLIQSNLILSIEMAYKKFFCVADFGMCYLEDLVNEVKDNKELVVEAEKDIIKLYRKGN